MTGHRLQKHTKPRPVLPTPGQTAVLRRVARGYMILTFIDGDRRFSYEDGSVVSESSRSIMRMIRERWLVADRGDTLLGEDDQPQIYRGRNGKW